jgi:uncharacterized membrane protein YjjP (DUF1212 family)
MNLPYSNTAVRIARQLPYRVDTIQRTLDFFGLHRGEQILHACTENGIDPDWLVDKLAEAKAPRPRSYWALRVVAFLVALAILWVAKPFIMVCIILFFHYLFGIG